MSYKVRFHLAHGANYQKWQVKKDNNIVFYDPEEVSLVMFNCKLKNHCTVAEQIFRGSHKTVCAWIECQDLQVIDSEQTIGEQIYYNPKIAPYWQYKQSNVDNCLFGLIKTCRKKVFVVNFALVLSK